MGHKGDGRKQKTVWEAAVAGRSREEGLADSRSPRLSDTGVQTSRQV